MSYKQPLFGSSELLENEYSSSAAHAVDADEDTEHGVLIESGRDSELQISIKDALNEVAQARAVLKSLGKKPDYEALQHSRSNEAQIESRLSKHLEEIVLEKRPDGVDRLEWRAQQAEREKEVRQTAEKEKFPYQALINAYEMHVAYEEILKNAENQLSNVYSSGVEDAEVLSLKDEVNDELVRILQDAAQKKLEKLELKGRVISFIPDAFCKLATLVMVDLSNNKLEGIPDAIAGLKNLEELNLSSNCLVSLPDSMGLLTSLKILNVSGNKLKALPDSVSKCSSLTEVDASFNYLTYLPTDLGHGLVNLQKLDVHLNKLRSLPCSICEMKSLRILDVHFNELVSLPLAIGKLENLEVLNASKNFSDLMNIPDSVGDLTNLVELDLSNNQITELPCSLGRLQHVKKLNLDENPLVIPPQEIIEKGVDAVMEYMAKRWVEFLVEEELKSSLEASSNTAQQNWMQRSGQWFQELLTGVTESLLGYKGSSRKSDEDDFLKDQL